MVRWLLLLLCFFLGRSPVKPRGYACSGSRQCTERFEPESDCLAKNCRHREKLQAPLEISAPIEAPASFYLLDRMPSERRIRRVEAAYLFYFL